MSAVLRAALGVLAAVLVLVAIAAVHGRPRPVPVAWTTDGIVLHPTRILAWRGAVDPAVFAPCAAPQLQAIALVSPGPFIESPGVVDRFTCEWPRARARYGFLRVPAPLISKIR